MSLLRSLCIFAVTLTFLALAISCGDDDDSPNGTETPTPIDTSGSGTISADGTISFINEFGDIVTSNPDGSEQNTITAGGGFLDYRWSPNGSQIAATYDLGGVQQVSVMRDTGEFLFDIPGATSFEWSRDGTRLAAARPEGLVVVDATGAELRQVPNAVRPEWSPDASTLAVVKVGSDGMGVPALVHVDSGDELPLADGIAPSAPDYPLYWHPAGGVIAYRDRLYEPATGTQTELPGVATGWSPDGRLLLVSDGFDTTENATSGLLLDFSQGGMQIIGLYIREDPGGQPPWLFAHKWMTWSDDARHLFYLDPNPFGLQVRLYDTVAVNQTRYENIKGEDPDISPDGTHAAFSSEGGVWVFKLDASALREVAKGTHAQFLPHS